VCGTNPSTLHIRQLYISVKFGAGKSLLEGPGEEGEYGPDAPGLGSRVKTVVYVTKFDPHEDLKSIT